MIIRKDSGPNRFAEAVKWCEKAFDSGMKRVAIKLAKIYFTGGGGVERDYAKAAEWTIIAVENGEKTTIPELIHMYEKGLGIEKNQQEADKWRKVLTDYEPEKER